MNKNISLTASTVTTALGVGRSANYEALKQSRTGLQKNGFAGIEFDTYIGQVDGVDDVILPKELTDFDCRNNRLAELSLQQDGIFEAIEELKAHYGAGRVGLFIGTSTSGIQQTEMAYAARAPETKWPMLRVPLKQGNCQPGSSTRRHMMFFHLQLIWSNDWVCVGRCR